MEMFKRNLQVIISSNEAFKGAPYKVPENEELTIPQDPFTENFMIKFSVASATNSCFPADSFVTIYNLNDKHLSFIKNRGALIQVLAGYGKTNSLIYDGQIDTVDTKKSNTNIKTKISLVNHVYTINEANFKCSYLGYTTVKEIIQAASQTLQIPCRGFEVIPSDAAIGYYSYNGSTKKLFDKLLKPLNIEWFVNNDFVEFTKIGNAKTVEVPLVSEDTGMVRSPTLTTDGIVVRSLLNPKIIAGNAVQIQSNASVTTSDGRQTNQLRQSYNGVFKVISTVHHGDTMDGLFFTDVVCRPFNDDANSGGDE